MEQRYSGVISRTLHRTERRVSTSEEATPLVIEPLESRRLLSAGADDRQDGRDDDGLARRREHHQPQREQDREGAGAGVGQGAGRMVVTTGIDLITAALLKVARGNVADLVG